MNGDDNIERRVADLERKLARREKVEKEIRQAEEKAYIRQTCNHRWINNDGFGRFQKCVRCGSVRMAWYKRGEGPLGY